MNKMIFSNLVHRPFRTLISVVAVAVEVTLILLIVGLSIGMLTDTKNRQVGIGADIMVQPPGSSLIMGVSGAPVSIKVADKLRKLEHVVAVAPVVTQLSTAGNLEVIDGIDLHTFEAMGGPFHYLSGGPFQDANDMLIDDYVASSKKLRVGDTIEFLNHPFRICGIVEHGKGARKFLPILTFHSMPGLSTFINVVIGISMIIGFIVIFQAMYAAVMERTREIGILKSLGAGKFYIVNVILRETILISIGGIILGIIVSYTARAALHAKFQTLPILITPEWLIRAAIIAVIGSMLGAAYPAMKAAQKDPIDALAYE